MRKSTSGFTVVELLVVIVVIAILAAVTIVSYRSITQRANNTAVISDLSTLWKELEMARMDAGGNYPSPNLPSLNALKFQVSTTSYDTTKWCFAYYVSADKQEYFVYGISKSGDTFYISHESSAPRKAEGGFQYKGTTYSTSNTLVSANSLAGYSGYSLTDKQWRQWTLGGA